MNLPNTMGSTSLEEHSTTQSSTQTEQAVVDAYGSATPTMRGLMLSRLLGQAFEALPVDGRLVMITHLLRPLGMLSRATVADGIFLNNQFFGKTPDLAVVAAEMQRIQVSAVVDLANRVQQVSVEVVDEIAKIIKTSPQMANSPVVAILEKIPLRRTRARQADDRFS